MVHNRILMVDDEPNMLGLLSRIITEVNGCTVMTESNPLEIPALLEQRNFDLIIADLKMPGMDGFDILRLVRDGRRPEKVIIITAFGSLESMSEAIALGAFAYIIKPFKKDRLLEAVRRALDRQRESRTASHLLGLLELEPVEKAVEAFREAYARWRSDADSTRDREELH